MLEHHITKTDGDALSRLIQLQAGRHDIRLTWSGKGVQDLIALLHAHALKARLSKHLWTALRDLTQMTEMHTLPEPLQAHIMSTILKAQALVDLETDDHARRMTLIDTKKERA